MWWYAGAGLTIKKRQSWEGQVCVHIPINRAKNRSALNWDRYTVPQFVCFWCWNLLLWFSGCLWMAEGGATVKQLDRWTDSGTEDAVTSDLAAAVADLHRRSGLGEILWFIFMLKFCSVSHYCQRNGCTVLGGSKKNWTRPPRVWGGNIKTSRVFLHTVTLHHWLPDAQD